MKLFLHPCHSVTFGPIASFFDGKGGIGR